MPSHHHHHLINRALPAIVSSDSVKLSVSLNSLNGISTALFRLLCTLIHLRSRPFNAPIHRQSTTHPLAHPYSLNTIIDSYGPKHIKLLLRAYNTQIHTYICLSDVQCTMYMYAHFIEPWDLRMGKKTRGYFFI